MKSTPENTSAKPSSPSEEAKTPTDAKPAASGKPADDQKPSQHHADKPTAETNSPAKTPASKPQTPASPSANTAAASAPGKDSGTHEPKAQATPSSAGAAKSAPPVQQPVQPVPPAATKPQQSHSGSSSHGFLPIFSLLLATGAIVCAVMIWQRMGQMEQQLNLSLQQGGSSAETARALAQQSLDASNDTRGKLSYVNTQIEALNEQSKRIDSLMQLVNNSETKTLVSDLRAMLQSAQLQTHLTGSVEPLLVTLQTIDERLTQDSLSPQSPLRSAIATDIDNIRNAAIPDPMRMSTQISELLDRVNNDMPLLIDPAQSETTTRNLTTIAPLPQSGNRSDNTMPPQEGVLGYLERSWNWTSDKASELGTVIWGHVGTLVQVTPISNRDAMLITPEQGAMLRENIKLRLLNLRISVLQRQYTLAEKDVEAILAALNTYFNPENKNVQEMLRRLNTLKTGLQNVALPQPSTTLSALASMGQH